MDNEGLRPYRHLILSMKFFYLSRLKKTPISSNMAAATPFLSSPPRHPSPHPLAGCSTSSRSCVARPRPAAPPTQGRKGSADSPLPTHRGRYLHSCPSQQGGCQAISPRGQRGPAAPLAPYIINTFFLPFEVEENANFMIYFICGR